MSEQQPEHDKEARSRAVGSNAGLGFKIWVEIIELFEKEARPPTTFANKWLICVGHSANGGRGVFTCSAINSLVETTAGFALKECTTVFNKF